MIRFPLFLRRVLFVVLVALVFLAINREDWTEALFWVVFASLSGFYPWPDK